MIDVTAARAAVEATFDTRARVTRDPEGAGDDAFDPITGTVGAATAGDSGVVWEGPCRLRPDARLASAAEQGSQEIYADRYIARLPADALHVAIGDTFTVIETDTDPLKNGTQWTVTAVDGGSNSVTRLLSLTTRQRGTRA